MISVILSLVVRAKDYIFKTINLISVIYMSGNYTKDYIYEQFKLISVTCAPKGK